MVTTGGTPAPFAYPRPEREGKERSVLVRRGAVLVSVMNLVLGVLVGTFLVALSESLGGEPSSAGNTLTQLASGHTAMAIPALLAGGLVGLPLERWTRADSGWRRTGVAALAGVVVGGILGGSLSGGSAGLLFWGCALGALAALAGRAAVDTPLARNGRAVAVLVALVLVVDVVGLVGLVG